MLAFVLSVTLAAAPTPERWYGPVEAEFDVDFPGDPYDAAQNDVRVRFFGPNGRVDERLAWCDGQGRWRATLVTPVAGLYRAALWRNGKDCATVPTTIASEAREEVRFVRVAGDRFRLSDGSPYRPVGLNVAWKDDGGEVAAQIGTLAKAGGNWTRVWANHWDGKNPWWMPDAERRFGSLRPEVGDVWRGVLNACRDGRVFAQVVLFHHGPWSSTVNSNWPENPWSKANGGFLAAPEEFFTSEEAIRRTKNYLRYFVARFAADPGVMAWELFNEVEWTDGYKKAPETVEKWHADMAAYLRSLDPYGHPVTTSSTRERPGLWTAMDYFQPHVYTPGVAEAVGGERFEGKPGFFGEFGPADNADTDATPAAVRDGIWAGLLAGHAGAAQYWDWGIARRRDLYREFGQAARLVAESGREEHPDARPLTLRADTDERGDAVFVPAGGWGPSRVTAVDLAAPGGAARDVSAYRHSTEGAHPELAGDLRLTFPAGPARRIAAKIGETSKAGAVVTLRSGAAVKTVEVAEGQTPEIVIVAPAGTTEAMLEVRGKDWVRLGSFTVAGIAPTRTARGLGDASWALLRVTGTGTVRIAGTAFPDGDVRVRLWDLDGGPRSDRTATVRNGVLTLADLPRDVLVALDRS